MHTARLSTAALFVALAATAPQPANAQLEKVEARPNPTETKTFADLAEGPYERLVIRNVMVIPGHGGPASGPYDILVTGNVIAEMNQHDRNDPTRMQVTVSSRAKASM